MIQELVFTSAPKGLQLGSSGFCTVASTPGMAANLAKQLQGLSAYRHLNPPGSTGAKSNPVVYSHQKIKIGGKSFSILSRIADAGLDYSNRSNKLAHHFAVENIASLKETPSSILKNESQFFVNWNQDPTKLEPRSLVGSNSKLRPCNTWKTIVGDGGWAGDLIEAFDKQRTVYLIVSPTTPVLELIDEAAALLPLERQWDLTFSTFYTKTSGNIECNVRCVMDGSPEVALARRSKSNVVIDLTSNQGMSKSEFAGNARHGIAVGEKKSNLTPIGSELAKIEPGLADFFKPDLNEQIPQEAPSLDSKHTASPPVLMSGQPSYPIAETSNTPTLTTNYRPDETPVHQSESKYPLVAFCAVLLVLILGLIWAYPQVSNIANVNSNKKPEPEKPEPEKPEPEKPEPEKPEPEKPEREPESKPENLDEKYNNHGEVNIKPKVVVKNFEDIEELQNENVAELKQIKERLISYKKNPSQDNRTKLQQQLEKAINIDGKELFNKIDLANEKLEKEKRKNNLEKITVPADIEYAYGSKQEMIRQLIEFRERLTAAQKNFDQEENEANFRDYRKTLEDISLKYPDMNWSGKRLTFIIENLDNRLVKIEDIYHYSATNFATPNHGKGGKVYQLKPYDKSKLNFLHFRPSAGPGWKLSFYPKDGSYRYKQALGGTDGRQQYYENLKIEFSSSLQKETKKLWLGSPRSSQIFVKVSEDPDRGGTGGIQIPDWSFEIENFQEEKKEVRLFEYPDGKTANKAFLCIRRNQTTSKPEIYWTDKDGTEIQFKSEIDRLEKEWNKAIEKKYAKSFEKYNGFIQILAFFNLKPPSNPQGILSLKRKLENKITENNTTIKELMKRGLNAAPPPANQKRAKFLEGLNSSFRSLLTELEKQPYEQYKQNNIPFKKSDWAKEFKVFRLEKKDKRGDIWIICYLKEKPTQHEIDTQIKKEKQNQQRTARNPQSNDGVSSVEVSPCGG